MRRPRTTSLPPDEMIKLGEEMVKWVKEHEDILHLSEWYTIEKGFIYNEWKTFIQLPEFLPYYEQALRIVGRKYLDKTSDVRDGISQRWQRVYFGDLREREDEDLRNEIELKAKNAQQATQEEIDRAQRIFEQISRNQVSARNIEESKINAESKS